jgi:hypothetical protein
MLRGLLGASVTAVLLVGTALPAFAGIRITKAVYDPLGADHKTASQLRAEYIVVKNRGHRGRQLRGWTLVDQGGHEYRFPRYHLPAWASVRVHTGPGKRRRGHLYWGRDNFIWNDDGDEATLLNRLGRIVDSCSWEGGTGQQPPERC